MCLTTSTTLAAIPELSKAKGSTTLVLDSGCSYGGVVNDIRLMKNATIGEEMELAGIDGSNAPATTNVFGDGFMTKLAYMENATLNALGLGPLMDTIAEYREKTGGSIEDNHIAINNHTDSISCVMDGEEVLRFVRGGVEGNLYECSMADYIKARDRASKIKVMTIIDKEAQESLDSYLYGDDETHPIFQEDDEEIVPTKRKRIEDYEDSSDGEDEDAARANNFVLATSTSANTTSTSAPTIMYSKQELKRAEEVKTLQERLGFPSAGDLAWMLLDRRIEGYQHLVPEDVQRCYQLYGEPVARLKGTTVARNRGLRQGKTDATIKLDGRLINTQDIGADLFFVMGQAYIITVSSPLNFTMVKLISSKSSDSLVTALTQIRSAYGSKWHWKSIYSDGESGIIGAKTRIQLATGAKVEDAAGWHNNIVERKIRTIKQTLRCLLHSLEYQVPAYLVQFAVIFATNSVNQRPDRNYNTSCSPWQLFYGRPIDKKRDVGLAFGKICEIFPAKTKNNMEERTRTGIALHPMNNEIGSFKFAVLSSGDPYVSRKFEIVTGYRWAERQIPQRMIDALNRSEFRMRKELHENGMPKFEYKGQPVEELEEEESNIFIPIHEYVEGSSNSQGSNPNDENQHVTIHKGHKSKKHAPSSILDKSTEDEYDNPHNTATAGVDKHYENREYSATADASEDYENLENKDMAEANEDCENLENNANEEVAVPAIREKNAEVTDSREDEITPAESADGDRGSDKSGQRSASATDLDHVVNATDDLHPTIVGDGEDYIETSKLTSSRTEPYSTRARTRALVNAISIRYVLASKNLTIEEALRTQRDASETAIIDEFRQLRNKQVFEYLQKPDTNSLSSPKIIPCSMFLKDKWRPDGSFEKMKARLVAGGHKQDRSIYSKDETTAPTASITSVLAIATIAAKERRHVGTCDITGAYLNAEMISKQVIMKVNPTLSEYLCRADPMAKSFVNKNDRCIYVVLRKALYGTIEAANRWFDTLTASLKKIGFVHNSFDRCVMSRVESDGSVTHLVIYVDDLMVTNRSKHIIQSVFSHLESEFKEITSHHADEENYKVNYIGMLFEFSQYGTVNVSQPKYIDDCIKEASELIDKDKLVTSPADLDLFKIDKDKSILEKSDRENFHHMVAKLLYLTTRTRPDMAVAVNFLTTRVLQPTSQDIGKLKRCMNYLNSTKELHLRLGADGSTVFTLYAYADASFSVHVGCKSHSGGMLTYGIGAVHAASNKQTLVSKSAAEAELIACSDYGSIAIGHKQFLEGLGYKIGEIIYYQDNTAAKTLLENGRSNSKRTGHIHNKYYWLHDRMKQKDLKLVYMPTDDMIADILTKPLIGDKFRRLRDKLLGYI